MKEQDMKLTLQETEQLCKLYMDCRLSVLEEKELQYVLSQMDYHSPLIDEVRALMGLELTVGSRPFVNVNFKKKQLWHKRIVYTGIAASLALLFSIGMSFYHNSSSSQISSESYYLAYVGGKRLDDAAAKAKIEAEMQAAEDFIKEMSLLEAQEKEMIDNFITVNTIEQ